MPPLEPGFTVIHADKPELLREHLIRWFKKHPLEPLEDETILVQNNGIAQWLKLGLAATPTNEDDPACGIAAAVKMELPARFLWRAYRAVLTGECIPENSPLDKDPMTWRLMRLLPLLSSEQGFEPLAGYLQQDADLRKRYQLAEKIADLFDQYQIYRGDWLQAWANGRDILLTAANQEQSLAADQYWQPLLWRALLADTGESGRLNRVAVHQQFLEAAKSLQGRPSGIPRRITVFGISSLPEAYIKALQALAPFSQILLCVNTPSQFGSTFAPESAVGHPLLTSWGGQGRDYTAMLYETSPDRDRFKRISGSDAFKSHGRDTLLHRLQDDICLMRSVDQSREHWQKPDACDHSIRFHIAHSPQREVEILHDQLLAAFDEDPDLQPREVIVMAPDIQLYAPHIEAVFGRINRHDPRQIPFSLSDLGKRHQEPLLNALELLLHAPESRFAVSQILDLLDVPAVRQRFSITEDNLSLLRRWIEQSGIRWGLNADQRAQQISTDAKYEQNTWLHGLKRMLLGYAVGVDPTGREDLSWGNIEPYGEVAGLEAALAGQLARLLVNLEVLAGSLGAPRSPEAWGKTLSGLLDNFYSSNSPEDSALLWQLRATLDQWLDTCKSAGLNEDITLAVVRDHWLSQIDQAKLGQRFMAGYVTFASLMPMRAIPFKWICLLGMNDGDFPRSRPPVDFDLMALEPRPGDRSRREDDRCLFLDALLSARRSLHISWVGRSFQDNSVRPPSVLVSQLRDHLRDCQPKPDLLKALTLEHKLQPFSRDYFNEDVSPTRPLFTYAQEWERQKAESSTPIAEQCLPLPTLDAPLTFKQLSDFLKDPAKAFFRNRLGIFLESDDLTCIDQEPFAPDSLEEWGLQNTLIQSRLDALETRADEAATVDRELTRMERSGELPIGAAAALLKDELIKPLDKMFTQYTAALTAWPCTIEAQVVSYSLQVDGLKVVLEGRLDRFRSAGDQRCRIELSASNLLDDKQHYRHDKVLDAWVRHLAAHVGGKPVTTEIIGKNGTVQINPLNPETAKSHLNELIKAYVAGLCSPTPLAPETGFAWLKAQGKNFEGHLAACPQKAVGVARTKYEPGYKYSGEVANSPYRQRLFPSFEALWSAGCFTQRCETLYAPLLNAIGKPKKSNDTEAGTESND